MSKKAHKRPSTWIAILSGVGLLFASWLVYVHVRVYTDLTYEPVCALSQGLSCSRVAASRWSVFAGLPVAVWGVLAYVTMGLLALADRARGASQGYAGAMFALAWSFAAVGGVLAYVSTVRIESVCLLCFAVYLINGGLAVLSTLNARRRGRLLELWAREVKLFFSPIWEGAFMLLVVAAAVAALWVSYPRYWQVAAWVDGARLSSGLDENGDPWLGDPGAKTVIHEYLDFECPHCRTAHTKLRRLLARKDGIRLVRHDMSRGDCREALTEHPEWDGCGIMRGAFCATKQGRYWHFNDAVLSMPKPGTTQDRVGYEQRLAERIGLDMDAFGACLRSEEAFAAVKEKDERAHARKVRYTPTYFIGKKKVSLEDVFEVVVALPH